MFQTLKWAQTRLTINSRLNERAESNIDVEILKSLMELLHEVNLYIKDI